GRQAHRRGRRRLHDRAGRRRGDRRARARRDRGHRPPRLRGRGPMSARVATARARANIALAKYWGKLDDGKNLPAVPSVSITLDPLVTRTTVAFDDALEEDRFELDGAPAEPGELARVTLLLDEVRALSGLRAR